MAARHEALEIPEILRRISSYLPPGPDFTSCLQTCRFFHTILTPLLYNTLTLCPLENKRPTPEAVQRYIHLIGHLKFDFFMSAQYLRLGFKNLHSITISNRRIPGENDDYEFTQVGIDSEVMEALLVVIRENPALRRWTLWNPKPRPSAKVWRELSSLKKRDPPATGGQSVSVRPDFYRGVDILDITHISVTHEAKHWFLRACADARELRMLAVAFMVANGKPDNCQSFLQLEKRPPQGRKVEIVEFSGYNVIDQLTFLSHLVEAWSIAWTSPAAGRLPIQTLPLPTLTDLKQFIKPTTWPKLRALDLTGIPGRQLVKFSDECIAHILDCVPDNQLEEFKLQGSMFGPLGAQALRRQFPCLQDLRLEPDGIDAQSAFLQEVMESCPKLQVLQAGMFSVGHMRRGKAWICHGLKKLAVHVDLESDRDGAVVDKKIHKDPAYWTKYSSSRRYVFERLGKLTELQELDTSMPCYAYGRGMSYINLSHSYRHPYWTLDYQLLHGLDELVGLKKLERLDFSNTLQDLLQMDLEWMVENWPSLKMVTGDLRLSHAHSATLFMTGYSRRGARRSRVCLANTIWLNGTSSASMFLSTR
ncbi:hypothetical protein BG015_002119 [Linnemannia schmuckeri]|uniref:F-box domain-containing protein n=1 Tax=Linnemannia schmuckeri TaxID=64567 RepID=A0A9P5RPE8_9FUNG|nr:hypothetical protein BG015_002119 [Linnemannia schmuckeri]